MFELYHASDVPNNYKSTRFYSQNIKSIEDLKEYTLLDVETGCWEWQKGKHKEYGRMTWEGKPMDVHRVAWILGHPLDILSKKDFICHSCDNPACCNPAHLFLGDILINNQDSKAKGRRMHQKMTSCKNGHPRIAANLVRMKRPNGTERIECLICKRNNEKTRYRERKFE